MKIFNNMNFVFELKRNIISYINYTKDKYIHPIISDLLNTCNIYSDLNLQLRQSNDENSKIKLQIMRMIRYTNQSYLLKSLNIDLNNSYNILSKGIEKDFYITKITNDGNYYFIIDNVEKVNNTFKNIMYNMVSPFVYNIIKNESFNKKEDLLFKLLLI